MKPHLYHDALERIFAATASAFYRDFWTECPRSFAGVKLLPASRFLETDLYARLYREEPGLVKTVSAREGQPFLAKRAWSDIRSGRLPIESGARVFVLMDDTDEGLEYSLVAYEHNAIPYLGDTYNLEVALFCAEQFRSTVLICDHAMLRRLSEAHLIPASVEAIIVIDRSFDAFCYQLTATYRVSAFLALPETGLLAEITPERALRPAADTYIESIDGRCVVTKPDLITPLIRYQTEIACVPDGAILRLADHSSS